MYQVLITTTVSGGGSNGGAAGTVFTSANYAVHTVVATFDSAFNADKAVVSVRNQQRPQNVSQTAIRLN